MNGELMPREPSLLSVLSNLLIGRIRGVEDSGSPSAYDEEDTVPKEDVKEDLSSA